MLRYLKYAIAGHLAVNTAGVTCTVAMMPLNYITDTHCSGTNMAYSVKVHGIDRAPKTLFEKVVATQSEWFWGVFGIVPHPRGYLMNGQIIMRTLIAYPAAVEQIQLHGIRK